MEKKLNTSLISDRMLQLGLSQTELAEHLDVTKTAISSWLKPEKFPRPRHLLKLAELLKLSFDEIVLKAPDLQPAVAFRKSGNHKIQDSHREHFFYTSRLLSRLVPYLPFDDLSAPATLKDPKVDYDYIQKAAKAVRQEVGKEQIKFEDLLTIFDRLQAIVIPVLWGKEHYKNAIHVFLPESQTTWIFINLDTRIFDFNFWLAHELGHAKAPQLIEQEGEDFADRFAGALLFSSKLASQAYNKLKSCEQWNQIKLIQELAVEHTISPITIYKEVQAYAQHHSLETLDLERGRLIFKTTTQFNQKFQLLSETLFKADRPEPKEYLRASKTQFKTCFFDCLAAYIKEHDDDSSKFIANILDIPLTDAHSLLQGLRG